MSAFEWERWTYENGIREIKSAFDQSKIGAERSLAAIQAEFDKIKASGEQIPDGYQDHLIDSHYIEDKTLSIVRESFVIALHHYWEKQVADWIGSFRGSIALQYPTLLTKGYLLDKPRLERLRMTANCIKHNSSELYKNHPGMFDNTVAVAIAAKVEPDYYSALQITNADFADFINALEKSGPPGSARLAI